MSFSTFPILSIVRPILLASDRTFSPGEPLRAILLASSLPLPSLCPLLFFNTMFFIGSQVILAVFHCTLVRAESRVSRREMFSQAFWKSIQCDDKGCQIERNSTWPRMALPNQTCLSRFGILTGHLRFEPRGVACVDFIIPAPTNTPSRCSVAINDFASHLIRGRRLPASRFKIQVANLAGSPVFDFHQTVIVNSGIACDNANDRRGNFLPCVKLLSA